MKELLFKFVHWLHHLVFAVRYVFFKIIRKSTLDVRAIVINESQQVLLVRHTYMSGWYLPGGLVKYGESLSHAVARELFEETGIQSIDNPHFFGIYLGSMRGVPNYPAVFVINKYQQSPNKNFEIAQMAWYDWQKLPQDTSAATRRRLAEYFGKTTVSNEW